MKKNKFKPITTYTYIFKQGDSYLHRDSVRGLYGWVCYPVQFKEIELGRVKRYLKRNIDKNYSTDPKDPVVILKIRLTVMEESML